MSLSKSEMDSIMNKIMGPRPKTTVSKNMQKRKAKTTVSKSTKSKPKKVPLPTYDGDKYLEQGFKLQGNAKNFIDGVKASKSKISVISAGTILPLSVNKVLAKFKPELDHLGIKTPRDLENAIKANKNINLEHFQIKFTQELDTKDYSNAKQLQQKLGAKVEIDNEPKKKKVLAIEPEATDLDKVKDSSNEFERMMARKSENYVARNKKTGKVSSVAPKDINAILSPTQPKFSGSKLKGKKIAVFGDLEITKKSYIRAEPSYFEMFLKETLQPEEPLISSQEPVEEFDLDDHINVALD